MKGKILAVSIMFLIVLGSCQFYEEKDLGNNLILWGSDTGEGQYDIVYCGGYSLGSCKGGIYVIPSTEDRYSMYVETAKSNDKWIVAKTIRTADQKENYWIINKDFSLENIDCNTENCDSIIQAHITGALDYQEFTAKIKELGIDLKFEE